MMIGKNPSPLGSPPGEPVSSIATATTTAGGITASVEGAMRTCKQSNAGRRQRDDRMEDLLRVTNVETEYEKLHRGNGRGPPRGRADRSSRRGRRTGGRSERPSGHDPLWGWLGCDWFRAPAACGTRPDRPRFQSAWDVGDFSAGASVEEFRRDQPGGLAVEIRSIQHDGLLEAADDGGGLRRGHRRTERISIGRQQRDAGHLVQRATVVLFHGAAGELLRDVGPTQPLGGDVAPEGGESPILGEY